MDAVRLVRSGWSQAKVALHMGYPQGTISKWVKKAPRDGRKNIPTMSSRPNRSPCALPQAIVDAIVLEREKRNRCAEVVHDGLKKKDIVVSLSSVKRTLERQGLVKKRSPWKRWHGTFPRPIVETPGDLVQIDTIHIQQKGERKFYVYTAIDLFSRFAYAKVVWHINTHESLQFVKEAERAAGFSFHTVQSDNGQEFSSWFTENLGVMVSPIAIQGSESRTTMPISNASTGHLRRNVLIVFQGHFHCIETPSKYILPTTTGSGVIWESPL